MQVTSFVVIPGQQIDLKIKRINMNFGDFCNPKEIQNYLNFKHLNYFKS